jgi:hypothetical protein
MSMAKGEYSIWTASMWWTLQARRRVSDDISDRPRYFIFPSLMISLATQVSTRDFESMSEEMKVSYFFNSAIA